MTPSCIGDVTCKSVPAHPFSTPTDLSGTVNTGVIIGVVVAVVIVILTLISGIFVIVLVCMKRRDASESRGGKHLGAMGWDGVEYRMQ